MTVEDIINRDVVAEAPPDVFFQSQYEVAIWKNWLRLCNVEAAITIVRAEKIKHCMNYISGRCLSGFRFRNPSLSEGRLLKLLNDALESAAPAHGIVRHRLLRSVEKIAEMVPGFDIDDLRFGDSYALFVPERDFVLKRRYIKALVIALFGDGTEEALQVVDSSMVYGLSSQFLEGFQSAFNGGDLVRLASLWRNCVESWRSHADPTTLVRQMYQSAYCLPMVVDLIGDCIKAYADTDRYFSPYLAICNSSGLGKTKLTLSLAHKGVSFFICLREGGSGNPGRSWVADTVLENVPDATAMRKFLYAMLEAWIIVVPEWIPEKEHIARLHREFFKVEDNVDFLKVIGDIIAIRGVVDLKPVSTAAMKSGIVAIESSSVDVCIHDYHLTFWERVVEIYTDGVYISEVIIAETSSTDGSEETGIINPTLKHQSMLYRHGSEQH